MKMKDNKGLVLRELLIIIAFFAIIFAFGAYTAFQGGDKRKYEVFAQNARDFVAKTASYSNEYGRYQKEYYLYDVISSNYMKIYKNPFKGGGDCNPYESKVVVEANNEKYVTLRCGDYLISQQRYLSGYYKVYKVSNWGEKIGDDLEAETAKLYNYEKDGKVVLDEYVVMKELLVKFNEKENRNIKSLDQIDLKKYNVVTKTFYRTKKLVRENL